MVLKALHQRINRTVVPARPNRRSRTAMAIEDSRQDSQSSSTTSSCGSTIELLDSDDDRELEVGSADDGEVPVAHDDNTVDPMLKL